MEALQNDFNEFKTQRDASNDQIFTQFLDQTSKGYDSADVALQLFSGAGGTLLMLTGDSPPPAPRNRDTGTAKLPTADERIAQKKLEREQEAQEMTFGPILQLHCGLLHYAALWAFKPETPKLNDQFIAFLKAVATAYPQLPPPTNKQDFRHVAMSSSIISSYLGVRYWPDKSDPATWTIQMLPDLYKKYVLVPLQANHSPDVLAAWDVYTAMCQADSVAKPDQWLNVTQPTLLFDRGLDDYALSPNQEKLVALMAIVKQHPQHPEASAMISQIEVLLKNLQGGGKSVLATANPPVSANGPAASPDAPYVPVPDNSSQNTGPIHATPASSSLPAIIPNSATPPASAPSSPNLPPSTNTSGSR